MCIIVVGVVVAAFGISPVSLLAAKFARDCSFDSHGGADLLHCEHLLDWFCFQVVCSFVSSMPFLLLDFLSMAFVVS